MLLSEVMEPTRKRRNLKWILEPKGIISSLPTEVIHYIFSFFSIADCLELLRTIPKYTFIGKIIYRSIYERTVIYSNSPLSSFNNKAFRYSKALDYEELESIIERESSFVLPQKFVFSYTFSHEETRSDRHFFEFFLTQFKKSQRYFRLSKNFELIIDFFNKQKDLTPSNNYEVKFLGDILNSDLLIYNLVNLNLARFQNLSGCTAESLVKSKINRFINLESLTLNGLQIENFSEVDLPESLKILNLINNRMKHLPSNVDFLPLGLSCFNVSCNDIGNLKNVRLPENLEYLDLQLNSIVTLSQLKFPDSLKFLNLSGNEITIDDDETIDLPQNLKVLNLLRNSPLNGNVKNITMPDSLLRLYLDYQLKDDSDFCKDIQNIIIYA